MASIPGKSRDVFIFYPQAGAVVGYIIEEFGRDKMAAYLAAINTGGTVNGSFKEIYGKSIYEVENDWRAKFDADPLPINEETPVATDSTSDSDGTKVPLVEFEPSKNGADAGSDSGADAGSGQPAPTAIANPLPTVTPEFDFPDFPGTFKEKPAPNWLVAGIVIGLSIITGVWLFFSRRRMPKQKS
jgi:hypothetical protein